MSHRALVEAAIGALMLAVATSRAFAHCDTIDGPVVRDARAALEKRDVTSVLRWVGADKEPQIREAFQLAIAVRGLSRGTQRLADRFFFETLVRVHREGEGAPFTGLKQAGVELNPAIAASDKALETGSVEALATMLAAEAEHGIRQRFARAAAARMHSGENVERGREYVAAYVEFIHFAERLHHDATIGVTHEDHEAPHAGGPAH